MVTISLEKTRTSDDESAPAIQRDYSNAQQVNQLASACMEEENCYLDVKNAITARNETYQTSTTVADIIAVIEEMAYHVNILALEAVFEAARTGENGRDFAMLASEVMNLSKRSITFTKKMERLINNRDEQVEEGTQLFIESGNSYEEIVSSISQVRSIISELTLVSREQFSGLDKIKKAIGQIDEIALQNTPLVGESLST